MKRVIYAFFFFLLVLFMIAVLSVSKDYWHNRDYTGMFVSVFLLLLSLKGIRKCYRGAFKPEVIMVPQQNMPVTMMPGAMPNLQQNIPGASVEPNPEMDHIDDMSVQYNPYFADVYEEQLADQRRQQQIMQRQLQERQFLEQQQLVIQQQMLEQQRMAMEIADQQRLGQELLNQQMAQEILNRQTGPGHPLRR